MFTFQYYINNLFTIDLKIEDFIIFNYWYCETCTGLVEGLDCLNQGIEFNNLIVTIYPKTKEEFFKDWDLYAVKVYKNAKTDHKKILKENSFKSGIYLWYNNITKLYYIGQSKELGSVKRGRLDRYFHNSYLSSTNIGKSLLIKSLKKYKHLNFSVLILEYCPIELLDEREQFWINLLEPKYNILKFVKSSLEYKHSSTSLEKMRGPRPHFIPSMPANK